MPLKIGLTGGIGSGKTLVSSIFKHLGIPIYYADQAAKDLQNSDPNIKEKLIQLFGNEVYKDGNLNKNYLASIVFSDDQKLKALNAVMHPATLQAAAIWMQKQSTPYAIKEAALIFEANAQKDLDYIIGVYAPKEIRLNRTMLRDNSSAEQVLKRMQNQMDEEQKMKLCQFVVVNDEKQLLIPQVLAIHHQLIKLSQKNQISL
jgi:dephospho-CoA kinase